MRRYHHTIQPLHRWPEQNINRFTTLPSLTRGGGFFKGVVYCQIGFFDIQDPEIFGRCTMSVKGLFSRLGATKIGIWDVLVGIALGGQFGGHF